MKFFSIDIESTGLDPYHHHLLSIGAVYVDTQKPAEQIFGTDNHFHVLWKVDKIYGDPFALNMNAGLIARIAKGEGVENPVEELSKWITYKQMRDGKFVAAGKNFAGFDSKFLNFDEAIVKPAHRVLDPGSVYANGSDSIPPDLRECCKRANVPYEEDKAHDALYDAQRVAFCLYKHLTGHL